MRTSRRVQIARGRWIANRAAFDGGAIKITSGGSVSIEKGARRRGQTSLFLWRLLAVAFIFCLLMIYLMYSLVVQNQPQREFSDVWLPRQRIPPIEQILSEKPASVLSLRNQLLWEMKLVDWSEKTVQQSPVAIFYNVFIPENDNATATNHSTDSKRTRPKRALRIVREQLRQIATSYAGSSSGYNRASNHSALRPGTRDAIVNSI
jgi:hypothetical protein